MGFQITFRKPFDLSAFSLPVENSSKKMENSKDVWISEITHLHQGS
jgi:hypothetical protein